MASGTDRASTARRSRSLTAQGSAPLFAALGDELRLRLLARLSSGGPGPIARLAEGAQVSRQAFAKHLRVLEEVGLVRTARRGRANHYRLQPQRLLVAQRFLARLARR